MLHSQSSRTSTSGCGSGGGLDDRFDVILLNSNLMQGTSGLMYVSDSYLTIGQDGIRLNESVTNPANLQVPDSIAFALEEVSDHLPVMLKLVTQDATGIDAGQASFSHITAITGGNGTLGLRSNRPTPPFYAYLTAWMAASTGRDHLTHHHRGWCGYRPLSPRASTSSGSRAQNLCA
jgi:hypothetical protein